MSNPPKPTWDLVVNNYTDEDIKLLTRWSTEVKRMVASKEIGAEEGTPHVQARVTFRRTYRLTGLKKLAPPGWHWEETKCAQDSLYCMKHDSDVFINVDNRKQGHRTDLDKACETLRESGYRAVAEQHPSTFVRYYKGFKELERVLSEPPRDPDFQPREWQQDVLDMFPKLDNDRNILWVSDMEGNKGKSRLSSHLVKEHGAVVLSGKVADMAYAYNKEPIVLFDIPRTEAENVNHLFAFAEKLKNGILFSTKYESSTKIFKAPIIIFMANFHAPTDVWSADRLISMDI